MQELTALAGLMGAMVVGVISPGPSFVMVARVAVAQSRAHGLAAALGMGLGGVVFASAALLGLQAVLLALPSMYLALKIVGGLYLAYLGLRIFLAAKQPVLINDADDFEEFSTTASMPSQAPPWRAFWLGLATQLSNPKTAIVYASVFAAFLPATFSLGFVLLLLALVFAVEAGWYGLVATLLASAAPRRAYLRYKTWVDRLAGTVMLALGLKLIASARQL
jgi:threonine/homoserine/homoserine lactone efflux protein